jgi:hypothetical protein
MSDAINDDWSIIGTVEAGFDPIRANWPTRSARKS